LADFACLGELSAGSRDQERTTCMLRQTVAYKLTGHARLHGPYASEFGQS
jgi:hypothetical protein